MPILLMIAWRNQQYLNSLGRITSMVNLKMPGAVGSLCWGRGEYHAYSAAQSKMAKDPSPDIVFFLVCGTPSHVPLFRTRASSMRT